MLEKLNNYLEEKANNPPGYVLGAIVLLAGIFMLLLRLEIIPSQDSNFGYGRTPVLFLSLFFIVIGAYIIFYKITSLKIKNKSIISKLIVLFAIICFLVIFHIVLAGEYSDYSFLEFLILRGNFIFLVVLMVFYIVGILIIASIISDLRKKRRRKVK